MRNPFDAIEPVKPQEETREQRIQRHGHDPQDTAYRSHSYRFPPMPPLRPMNPAFLEAQRRIEGVIHQVRGQNPTLDAKAAWREAARQLGIDLDAIPPHTEAA